MEFNPFAISLTITGLIAAVIAVYIGTHRKAKGAGIFALGMTSLTIWSIAYGMELASTTLPEMYFWIRIEYLGIATLPVLWFIFVVKFTGFGKYLTPFRTVLLFIIPACTIALVATNNLHHVYFSAVSTITEGSLPLLNLTKGPWYWVHVTYSYVLLALGTFLLGWEWFESHRPYKDQIELMLAGILIPWIFDVTYISGIRPFTHLDPTPFGFLLTGLLVMTGLYWYHFLDLVPIARSRVFEAMHEGVIVVEKNGKIADMNPAVSRALGLPDLKIIGARAETILAEYPGIVRLIHEGKDAISEITTKDIPPRFLEIRCTRINEGDGERDVAGYLIIVQDISERRRGEDAIRTVLEKMKILSGITRHDINNQIMAMQSYLYLLDQECRDPTQKEYLSKVAEASDRIALMIRFTEDIQRFGIKDPSWHDLGNLITIAKENIGPEKILIRNEIQDISIFSDPLIIRVFPRLIENMLHYGKNVTRIQFSARVGNREGCVILCEDNGAGIHASLKEKIFLRNSGEDPGYSLYLTREILGISGLTIEETGYPGAGARFEIRVPEGSYRITNNEGSSGN
ncbi:MAG: histidine kinase N-terminal 7TM domain-containing protein [Methanoregulaceae archaeon]